MFIFILFALLCFLQITFRYNGNFNSFYTEFYQYLINNNKFSDDIYLQNNIAFEASRWWELVQIFNINLDNDYLGYGFHIVLSIFSIFSLYTKNIRIYFDRIL